MPRRAEPPSDQSAGVPGCGMFSSDPAEACVPLAVVSRALWLLARDAGFRRDPSRGVELALKHARREVYADASDEKERQS